MDNKLFRQKLASRSQPSSPLIDPAASSRHGLSPLRGRKSSASALEPSRKSHHSNEDTLLRGRWPSSSTSSKKTNTSLAEYLHEDRLSGFLDQGGNIDKSTSNGPQSLSRLHSCSEFSRFKEIKEEEEGRKISKENRPFGSSMRYIGKLKFPKSSSKPDSSPTILPGRMSVDENALANRRKATDFAVDFPSSESDRSDSTMKAMSPKIPRARNKDSNTKKAEKSLVPIRRTSSLTGKGPGLSPWALSPGRHSSSPPVPPSIVSASDGGGTPSRSFSSLRPASPVVADSRGKLKVPSSSAEVRAAVEQHFSERDLLMSE